MNVQVVVVVGGLLVGSVVLTAAWLFWMSVWAAFWHRRLRRGWTAELLGMVMGLLFPLTVPVGFAVLAVYWFMNQVRGTEHASDEPRVAWPLKPARWASSPTRRKLRPRVSNAVPSAMDDSDYVTDRR